MIFRIYKRNKNKLVDIIDINGKTNQTNQTNQTNIKRYLNLIKKTSSNKVEVYTEHTELILEFDDYIIVTYKKIKYDLDYFPNLKLYEYDKDINLVNIQINKLQQINKINKVNIIKEFVTFIELDVDDTFRESYSIETLLDQIKQQILNHK